MKLITILFACILLFSVGSCQTMPLIPTNEMNWSQSLPLNANITLNGGDVIGQTFATQYDTIVRQDGTNIYALYGKNKTSIDSGVIGSTVNSRVIRSAINATPANGSLYIDRGTYSLACDLNCTTNPALAYYWTALPITDDIHIKGAGAGATVLQMAPAQYSTTRPALIMYDYCPFSESGGDGVGPGHWSFSLEDLTLDGDVDNQTAPYYHDGAGLYLSGSMRYNAQIRNVEFKNSPNHGLYVGNNGGGWETRAVISNIYSHDNWGSDQFDNMEDSKIENYLSEGNGYGMWTASHVAFVLDGMYADHGHVIVNNLHVLNGRVYIFGFNKDEDDLRLQISNLYVDSSSINRFAIEILNCNSVYISNGKVVANAASYAVALQNAGSITLHGLELRGLRGVCTISGYISDVILYNCNIISSGDCIRISGIDHAYGSTAKLIGCDLYTSDPAAYLVNVQAGCVVNLVGCHGHIDGLIYVSGSSGVLTHSGTTGLGLEAYGATSVADGGVIAHGMKITPTYVTATGSLAGTTVTVTAKDATKLTIDLAGVTTTQTVYWHAVY